MICIRSLALSLFLMAGAAEARPAKVPSPAARQIALAKRVIAQGLRDPSSAQFRGIKVIMVEGEKKVCGEVNGKNAYGGYAGFEPFVYLIADEEAHMMSEQTPEWVEANRGCY